MFADCTGLETSAYVPRARRVGEAISWMLLLVLQEEKQGKRKGHDSPEGRRHKKPYHGSSHAMDWGHHPAAPPAYDSPQRMQRAYLPARAVGAGPLGRPPGKSNKSAGSPHKVPLPNPVWTPSHLSPLLPPPPEAASTLQTKLSLLLLHMSLVPLL